MFENFAATGGVSFILVFLEGILSFFSPCVIPLLPVYMGYLAGSGKSTGEDGTIQYEKKKVFLHTLFFMIGISFAFMILGMSFTALGSFFGEYKTLFTRVGGILILVLGLVQLGILDFSFLQKERKMNFSLAGKKMNPIVAFIMGFTFSFAWTPCVGPALSSVLIMASGASEKEVGYLLVLVYAAGFLIPFLLLGLFTTQVLNFLKKKQKLLKYTIKAGGIVLILMGIMTFTGWMNHISGYLTNFSTDSGSAENVAVVTGTVNEEVSAAPDENVTGTVSQEDGNSSDNNSASNAESGNATTEDSVTEPTADPAATEDSADTEERTIIPAFDFSLVDQYGNVHSIADYKGKVVFINFWATWCSPCKQELPDIEELYQDFNQNQDDVIILGIANPSSDAYPNNSDVSKEEIIQFLDDNGYTYPVLFDETGDVLQSYYISAFPTTFMIDTEGNIAGYVTGMMTKDIMNSIIDQTFALTE